MQYWMVIFILIASWCLCRNYTRWRVPLFFIDGTLCCFVGALYRFAGTLCCFAGALYRFAGTLYRFAGTLYRFAGKMNL
jgi:hypothetical protein